MTRILLAVLLVCLGLPAWAAAPVWIDEDTVVDAFGVPNASRLTVSVTVSAGSNSALVFSVSTRSAAVIVTSCVFNTTETATLLDTELNGSLRHEVWGLKNPTVTTANAVCTFSGAVGSGSRMSVHQYDNVGGFGTANSITGTSVNPGVSVTTTTADSVVFGGVTHASHSGTPFTPDAGTTERVDGTIGATSNDASYADLEKTATTAGIYTVSTTGGASGAWAAVGIEIKPVASGGGGTASVILINRDSGQCVTIPNGPGQPGLQMVQLPCRGPLEEQWTLQAVSGGYYQIVSVLNGLCLEVAGASLADNAAVQQSTCTNSPSMSWKKKVNGSWFQLIAKHSGKCMAISGNSRDDGAAVVQIGCTVHARWTISASPLPSLWSPKVTFTVIPAAAANMANGRLLLWSAYGRFYFGGNHGQTYTSIFDPATGQATETLVSITGHDMFCPGTSMLPDGRILVNGGSSSSKTSIFDPTSGIWSQSQQMNIPRGYNGNTVLSTGEVLTLGGSWSGGTGNKHAEVWSSGNGWRQLTGVPVDDFIGPDPKGVYRGDNHMWLIAASGGWVFHAGPAVQMHWIDTNGSGSIIAAGPRGNDAYAMNGNAVVYDTGRILKLGGAPRYDGGKATDGAYVIDIRGGPTAPVSVRSVAPMVFSRTLQNSVVLPNGQVVVVGGMNISYIFSDARPVYMAELWDPQTETFTRLAPMQTPRNYHSVALLMLDGRVFVGGGGLCTDNYTGVCPNHPDAEILTPPYLLNADGTLAARPVITAAPAMAAPGTTITVNTDTPVTTFALIRMSAVTHSVNNDQRRVPLTITGGDPTAGYVLPLPTDTGTLLPGNYMLFALNSTGQPSVAKVIQIR